jgi:hypothetical protein
MHQSAASVRFGAVCCARRRFGKARNTLIASHCIIIRLETHRRIEIAVMQLIDRVLPAVRPLLVVGPPSYRSDSIRCSISFVSRCIFSDLFVHSRATRRFV